MGTIPSETIPARYVATSLGMVVGLGEILGGVAGPWLAGWAADLYGLRAPLLIQGGCAIVGCLLALFLGRPRRCGSVRRCRRMSAPARI